MDKIITQDTLPHALSLIKSRGKLVLVGGCFDILHKGHRLFLKKAREQGDSIMVLLESDASITKWKGKDRPINTQNKRAQKLSGIDEVDFILLLPEFKKDLEYYDLVKKIEPDIIAVTSGDPAYNKKAEQAKIVKGEIVEVINRLPQYSTTDLIKKRKEQK
ncbi:MAG: adenylyltransferase/cytidyltransferase family protein [Candidatus Levybacteria bacterium]|nr:adenylyltransferase/cytidyltransferase family protein [Candidatus Levybacteria bacterium]MBP9814914.1 adenylyltransferase/cytidyltransferase family protein [Candidatus Levybacteria bacterium]